MTSKISDTVGPVAFVDFFGQDLDTTTGLTFGFKSGFVRNGTTPTSVSAGTVSLSASSNNRVYLDLLATPPDIKNANTGSLPIQGSSVFLFAVDTDSSNITSVTDLRNWTTGITLGA